MNEVDRILDLPGKAPDVDLTGRFMRPGGRMRLRPVQSQILMEAHKAQGLIGFVPVGAGKTLPFFLLPWVLGAERPLLLIPASVRIQCIADWEYYGQHFKLPELLFVRSYSELSRRPRMLRELRPDAILCDECQRLANSDSNRTGRLARYMKEFRPKFVGMSGTMTTNSVEDFDHLMRWALRGQTPLPLHGSMRRSWVACLSRTGQPTARDRRSMGRLVAKYGVETPREAFQARIVDCRGIVHMADASPPARLVLHARRVEAPPVVSAALERLKEFWATPGGDELDSSLSYMAVESQIACGFYYVWDWRGEPDIQWLEARNGWFKTVRKFCSRGIEGLDSPGLAKSACERLVQGERRVRLPKSLVENYLVWRAHMHKKPPPLKAVWLSDFLIDDIGAWLSEQTDPPLIWYGHDAFATRAARKLRIEKFGGGDAAAIKLRGATSPRVAMCSIKAHHFGKNLHVWGNQIIAHALPTGAIWEQLLGRTHRSKQERDEVFATYYDFGPFSDYFLVARGGGRYIETVTGQRQRLNYADYTDPAAAAWVQTNEESVAVTEPDLGSLLGTGLGPGEEAG